MNLDALRKLSDRETVALLLQDDKSAWHFVITEIMMPLVKTRKYIEILAKLNEPLESVPGRVYLDLQKNDFHKLKNFRFEGPFRAWLYFQVKNAVKSILHESRSPFSVSLSEELLEKPLYEQSVMDQTAELQDEMAVGDACFVRLWKDNPLHAYVLLLRNRLELPAEEIKVLLGLTSANNVDQINRRAKQRMSHYKKEAFK